MEDEVGIDNENINEEDEDIIEDIYDWSQLKQEVQNMKLTNQTI